MRDGTKPDVIVFNEQKLSRNSSEYKFSPRYPDRFAYLNSFRGGQSCISSRTEIHLNQRGAHLSRGISLYPDNSRLSGLIIGFQPRSAMHSAIRPLRWNVQRFDPSSNIFHERCLSSTVPPIQLLINLPIRLSLGSFRGKHPPTYPGSLISRPLRS